MISLRIESNSQSHFHHDASLLRIDNTHSHRDRYDVSVRISTLRHQTILVHQISEHLPPTTIIGRTDVQKDAEAISRLIKERITPLIFQFVLLRLIP